MKKKEANISAWAVGLELELLTLYTAPSLGGRIQNREKLGSAWVTTSPWWLQVLASMRSLVRHKALADTCTDVASGLANEAGITATTREFIIDMRTETLAAQSLTLNMFLTLNVKTTNSISIAMNNFVNDLNYRQNLSVFIEIKPSVVNLTDPVC